MLTKMKVALALCGSILVGGVGLAAAQGAGGSPDKTEVRAEMKAKHEAKKAEMLAKYDINKDGKLDESERAVMKNERAQEAFKKADTNGDGQLSLDEFKAMKQHDGMRHGRGGKFHHRGEGARGQKGGE